LLTYDHDPADDIGPDATIEGLGAAFERTRANPFNRFRWEAVLRDRIDDDDADDDDDDLDEEDDELDDADDSE
jgi:hypothetical protein